MHNIDQTSNPNKEGEGSPYLTPTPPWSPEPTSSLNLQNYDNFYDYYPTHDFQATQNGMFNNVYSNDQSLIPSMLQSNQSVQAMPNPHYQNNTTDEAEEEAKIVSRRTSNRESKAYEREHINIIKESYIENDKLFEEMKKQVQAGADCKKLCENFCERYKPIPQKARRVTRKISKSKEASAKNAPSNSSTNRDEHILIELSKSIAMTKRSTQRFAEREYYHRNEQSENPFLQRIFGRSQTHGLVQKASLSEFTTKSKPKDELPELVPDEEIHGWAPLMFYINICEFINPVLFFLSAFY